MVVGERRFKTIGTRPVRHDGVEKVTGRAVYGADVRPAGVLYGRVKRSPHAHAIVKRVDVSKALALPGVKAVVTHADLPDPGDLVVYQYPAGPTPMRRIHAHHLAKEKVLFTGHAIAAVCATDPHIAEDALELIEVQYELLPPVLHVRDAMAESAPVLHAELRTEEALGAAATADRPTNVAKHVVLAQGDAAAALAGAEVVVEGTFATAMAHQGYIEPHNATALWREDGHLTVWTSSQGQFAIQQQLADLLLLPVSQITVVPTEIGGGFGGKTRPYLEPLAALLSRKTRQPVKMWMSRQEVFEVTGPTSGTESWVRIGATREGRIVGAEARYWYEAGAQPGSPFLSGMGTAFSAYDIPNLHVEGWDVVVNKPKVAAYRAPGGPAAVFPVESLLDELARVLGLDPLELRLRNAAVEGTRIVTGQRFGPIGNRQVLEAAARSEHYRSELSGEHRGRGVAAAWWHTGGGESAAYASITADGRVQLVTGSVDIGGQRAGLAMQLAETLGIAVADVHPLVADTASIGYTMSTVGSRTAFASGLAVYECGMDLRRQLEARAAAIWEVDAAGVAYDAERGCVRGPGGRQFAFKELAAQLPATGGLIQGRASVNPGGGGDAFGAHVVDVEVDPDTGKVTILRYTAVQDVGTAVHPAYAEGQLQGGVLQGAGMALSEEYVYGDDGVMRNASMLDYRMPTTVDLPMIETVLVEVPNPEHPFGVRGVSELPIMPPLGAIANAIFDATGVRVRELPASPRVLLEQLLAAE